jgi:hypothetical protein
MMPIEARDVETSVVAELGVGLIICASGYERRARFFSKRHLQSFDRGAVRKVAIGFSDFQQNAERERNDYYFKRAGFETISSWEGRFGQITQFLNDYFLNTNSTHDVIIDYTAMRREMYGEILQFIEHGLAPTGTRFLFVYSVGKPYRRLAPKIISDYVVLAGFGGHNSGFKEKAAIYNLGYEPIIVQSIHEWLEPAESIAFYANPGVEAGSGEYCLKKNQRFIEKSKCTLVPQSLFNVAGYSRTFRECVKGLRDTYDIIVCSVGPKPFTLGALIGSISNFTGTHVYPRGTEYVPIGPQPSGVVISTLVWKVA